ncbi:hypothetical protein SUGI_0358020 [Cryptomeria japonica]|nr:hypothetical protein SUGI_0358020 [Cryptomeria japonica]
MVKKFGNSLKNTSSSNQPHLDSEEAKKSDPVPSAPPPIDPSSQPRVAESPPSFDPSPPLPQPQTLPCTSTSPPSIAEAILKYQLALKEANQTSSESDVLGTYMNILANPLGEPRKQNAQQIVFEKLKMAADHRKKLELALYNQKMEIESCTIPFLQELIGGEDGGSQVVTSATEKVSHSPYGPIISMNGPTKDISTPHMENISEETKTGGDIESSKQINITSDNTDGEVEPTTSPSDQPLEKGHDTESGIQSAVNVDDNIVKENPFSPDPKTFELDLEKFDKWIKEGATTVYIRELSHGFTWERDEPRKAAFEQALMAFMRQVDCRHLQMESSREEADLIHQSTSHPHRQDILDGLWKYGKMERRVGWPGSQ